MAPPPVLPQFMPCVQCGTPTAKRCKWCRVVPYCCEECESAHTESHSPECVGFQLRRDDNAERMIVAYVSSTLGTRCEGITWGLSPEVEDLMNLKTPFTSHAFVLAMFDVPTKTVQVGCFVGMVLLSLAKSKTPPHSAIEIEYPATPPHLAMDGYGWDFKERVRRVQKSYALRPFDPATFGAVNVPATLVTTSWTAHPDSPIADIRTTYERARQWVLQVDNVHVGFIKEGRNAVAMGGPLSAWGQFMVKEHVDFATRVKPDYVRNPEAKELHEAIALAKEYHSEGAPMPVFIY